MLKKEDLVKIYNDLKNEERVDYSQMMTRQNTPDRISKIYTNPESLGNCIYLLINKGYSFEAISAATAKLKNVEISNASFGKANLTNASFDQGILRSVSFREAKLSGCSFYGAKLVDVDFTYSEINNADFRYVIFSGSTLSTISNAKYWGSAKLDEDTRRRLERLHVKTQNIT